MLDEGGNVHTLQTWDEERQAWLDPMRVRDLETEEARRGVEEAKRLAVQETIAQIQMENLLALLKQQATQGTLAPDVPDFTEALRVTSGEQD